MLAPLSLRICCFAVMAPALTEAATQAQQSFKLPPSPASSSSNSNPPSPLGTITEKCISNDVLPHANDFHKSKLNLNNLYGGQIQNLNKPSSVNSSHCFPEIADESFELSGKNNKINSRNNTMNKSDLILQPENMGLQQASAKLSLETHARIEMDVPNVKDIMDVDTPASSPYSSSLDNSLVENIKKSEENAVPIMCHSGPIPGSCNNLLPSNNRSTRSITATAPIIVKRTTAIEKRTERLLYRLHKLQFKQSEKHIAEQLSSFIDHHRKGLRVGCPHRCNDSTPVSSADLLQSEEMKNMSTAALVNLVRKLEAKNGPSVFRHKPNYSSFMGINNSNLLGSSCDNVMNHEKIGIKSESSCIHTEKNIKLSAEKCKEIQRVSGTITKNMRILESAIDSDATDSSSGGESCDELDGYSDKDKQPLKTLPIHRRAAWKWAVDRAAVASRWTWLQAQISDLEYRIRKQSDIYKHLKSSKSSVSLEDAINDRNMAEFCETCRDNKLEIKNNHMTIPAVEIIKSSSITNSNNIYKNSKLSESVSWTSHLDHVQQMLESVSCEHKKLNNVCSDDRTCVASRVRPLQEGFKRRKLLRTSDIHKFNHKIAKSNSVRCRCLPHTQCTLCGGRYNVTQSCEMDSSCVDERIAAIDPSYHSVLSFKQDISIPVRFERLLKGGEWQKVNSKAQPPIKKKSNLTLNNHARSHSKKLAKSAAAQLLSSAKLRKKLVDKKHGRTSLPAKNGASLRKKRAAAKMALAAFKKHHLLEREQFGSSSGNSSKAGSPNPSPAPPDMTLPGSVKLPGNALQNNNAIIDAARKRRDSAYDIDNIVIPYSMTASTRIEKLQYKEIITPKWRLLEDNESVISKEELCKNNGIIIPVDEKIDEAEDISDDVFTVRHSICEAMEKKRFLGIVNQPSGRTRSRVSRIDSRADSSGANTPDPMSPHAVDQMLSDNLSPVTSPVTPLLHSDDSMPANPSSLYSNSLTNVRLQERRRTISASGKDVGIMRIGFESGATSPEHEGVQIIPYDSRTFPLSDEEYKELLEISSQVHTPVMISSEVLKNSARNFSLVPTTDTDLSRPVTPEFPSSASGSIIDEHEDPNDPEWTVIANERAVQRQSSIVLKLTKR